MPGGSGSSGVTAAPPPAAGVEGLSNKMIARDLDLAVGTVKAHVRAILEKLDARSRTQAAAQARRRGLVEAASAKA
jgi:hypothetical protein